MWKFRLFRNSMIVLVLGMLLAAVLLYGQVQTQFYDRLVIGMGVLNNISFNNSVTITDDKYDGIASVLTTTATVVNSTTVNISGKFDFLPTQNIMIWAAGPAPTVTTPTNLQLSPVNQTGANGVVTGCIVADSLGWSTNGSPKVLLQDMNMYQIGDTLTLAGGTFAGSTVIINMDDSDSSVTLASNATNTRNGVAVTGSNCTTTRGVSAFAIDNKGGMSAVTSTVYNTVTSNSINHQNWDVAAVDYQANAAIAYCYCKGAACNPNTSGLSATEVPTYTYSNTGAAFPANDPWIETGTTKVLPSAIFNHDFNRPHTWDFILGHACPTSPVNQIYYGKIVSMKRVPYSQTQWQLTFNTPMSVTSGTFTIGHDNSPSIQDAYIDVTDSKSQSGTINFPKAPNKQSYVIGAPLYLARGNGLILKGNGGWIGIEANSNPDRYNQITYRGPLGWIPLTLNQQAHPRLDNISIGSMGGTSASFQLDFDGYDDGGGIAATCTHLVIENSTIGIGGIRMGNINVGNCEFNTIQDSQVNIGYSDVTSPYSNHDAAIGLLQNSSNVLDTVCSQSQIGGGIGVWTHLSGFKGIVCPTGSTGGVAIGNPSGYGAPISLSFARYEHMERLIQIFNSPGSNGAVQQYALISNEFPDLRIPPDGYIGTITGAGKLTLIGNTFETTYKGYNGNWLSGPTGGLFYNNLGTAFLANNLWPQNQSSVGSGFSDYSSFGDSYVSSTGVIAQLASIVSSKTSTFAALKYSNTGGISIITDATACTGAACVGGGAVTCLAVKNGATWYCP